MLPGSHVRIPLNLKLQQERIKTCNSKPNSFFKKLFKGSWRCPAFLKNQCGKLPEPSNSPIYWKQMKNLSKPNASQKRVRWREMKGILEKNGKYDRLGKSLQERARLNTILWYFPRGKNYSRGIGDTLHSSKTKVSSCQNHPTRPETGKKMKHLSKPNASQLWREMKEIWEKEGKNMKG